MNRRRNIDRPVAARLLLALLACSWIIPARAADEPDAAAQQLSGRASELAQQQLQLAQQRLQALQEPQRLKQLESLDRGAGREQLEALQNYDFSRVQRLAQIAALDNNLSPRHPHHRQAVDAGDDAGGGNPINERRPLNADGRIHVNNIAGDVVVKAWDRNEVLISGELGSGADHLEISGDPSNLSVTVKPSKHSHDSGESDLRLQVPAGARVELETFSADVSVQGMRGPLKVTTISGDVGIDVQSPDVTVQTVSGDVTLHAPSSSTQANTVSGDLHLSGLQGKLVAGTVSGNLSVDGSSFSDLKLKSVSGDMGLDGSFSPQAVVSGETLSGAITLHVPANVSGTATIKSFSGEAQCDLPKTSYAPSSASSGSRNLHQKRELVFGDGKGVNLQLSTFSGDVRIDHQSAPPEPAEPLNLVASPEQ